VDRAPGTSPGVTSGGGQDRDAQITIYPDGPMLLRGDVEIRQPDGTPLPRRRRTVALCRCGHSGLMPFCDGTHKVVWQPGRETGASRRVAAEE
jgi:CDGSH-type Zn-finger protein